MPSVMLAKDALGQLAGNGHYSPSSSRPSRRSTAPLTPSTMVPSPAREPRSAATVADRQQSPTVNTATSSRTRSPKQSSQPSSRTASQSLKSPFARVGSFVRSRLSRHSGSKLDRPIPLDADSAVGASVDNSVLVSPVDRIGSPGRMTASPAIFTLSPTTSPIGSTAPSLARADSRSCRAGSRPGSGHSSQCQQSTTSQSPPRRAGSLIWDSAITSRFRDHGPFRKRAASVSRLMVDQKLAVVEPTTGADTGPLQFSYSNMAVAGTGARARRLSACMPDEFVIDFCELSKEFKSSSMLPGKRGHTVGKGATATVTVMTRRGSSKEQLYAVKEFRKRSKTEPEDDYLKKVYSEYSVAQSLKHPNIVKTARLCTQSGRWNHVMEFCQVGEMYGLVERGLFRNHYKIDDRLCFFKQLVQGVEYLHNHGIGHRDIKLENLLMTSDGHVKITDFGVSDVFSGEHPGLRSARGRCGLNMHEIRLCGPGICGSMPYIAPEVLARDKHYDPRPLDVWSCAIVFLTMTYSGSPWPSAKTEHANYARFIQGWTEWLKTHPDGVITDEPDGSPKCGLIFSRLDSPPLKRLLLKMLNPDPAKRITIQEVNRSSVVRSTECCVDAQPEGSDSEESSGEVGCVDVSKVRRSKMRVIKKHNHVPPREHRTPKAFQHRFDMGHGWY